MLFNFVLPQPTILNFKDCSSGEKYFVLKNVPNLNKYTKNGFDGKLNCFFKLTIKNKL